MNCLVGHTIAHFKILELIGEGGMGIVFKALDLKLDRIVALKFLPSILRSTPYERDRLLREAKIASSLDHPGICTIHEIDELPDSGFFIVMAYYPGETLQEEIQHNPLDVDDALDIAIQVCDAMRAAHEKGVIHGDLKSSNILLAADCERGQRTAKIIDFGLAQDCRCSCLLPTEGGTLPYMSPERTRGEPSDEQSDIWSFGVVVYEMLTGGLPFIDSYREATVYRIAHEQPISIGSIRDGVPPSVEQVVLRCLKKEPSLRYRNMREVLDDLHSLRANQICDVSSSSEMHEDAKTASQSASIATALWPEGNSFFRYLRITLFGLQVFSLEQRSRSASPSH